MLSKHTWLSPVLVHDDEVSDVVGPARLHQLFDHIVTTVDPLGVGKHQTQLLKQSNPQITTIALPTTLQSLMGQSHDH